MHSAWTKKYSRALGIDQLEFANTTDLPNTHYQATSLYFKSIPYNKNAATYHEALTWLYFAG